MGRRRRRRGPNRREYWANTDAAPGSGDSPALDLLGSRFDGLDRPGATSKATSVWDLRRGYRTSRATSTFFDEANAEVFIKVLDTCAAAGSFWVFDTHLSNVEFTILVTDTQTGQTRTIFNPLGYSPPSILGTNTIFTECGDGSGSGLPRSESIPISTLPPNATPAIEEYEDSGVIGPCIQDVNTICLENARFRVHATYQDFEGNGGNTPAVA